MEINWKYLEIFFLVSDLSNAKMSTSCITGKLDSLHCLHGPGICSSGSSRSVRVGGRQNTRSDYAVTIGLGPFDALQNVKDLIVSEKMSDHFQ